MLFILTLKTALSYFCIEKYYALATERLSPQPIFRALSYPKSIPVTTPVSLSATYTPGNIV